jgi:N-acetylneuraminic acid mutarotase
LTLTGDTFTERSGHTSILDNINGKVYIFGGFNGKEVLNDLFILDIHELSWTQLNYSEEEMIHYPKPRVSHAACLDEDFKDRMYIFGGSGKNFGSENFNDLWVFDFSTKKFREIQCSKI